jgi:hypothetical protein
VNKTDTGASYWNSGAYEYDGAGNVVKIGSDWFLYDRVNRIKEGTAGVSPYTGKRRKQNYHSSDKASRRRRRRKFKRAPSGFTTQKITLKQRMLTLLYWRIFRIPALRQRT